VKDYKIKFTKLFLNSKIRKIRRKINFVARSMLFFELFYGIFSKVERPLDPDRDLEMNAPALDLLIAFL
jgi:hypothetical protein